MATFSASSSSSTSSTIPTPSNPAEQPNIFGDLDQLREEAKTELLEILDSLRGRKCLILDTALGGLLNQVIVEGNRLLKDNGVQYVRELKGGLGEFVSEGSGGGRDVPDNLVYLVRPNLAMMKVISAQVQSCLKAGIRSQYHVYFVPHRTVACEQMLEDEGVLSHLEIGEFHMGLVPFDTDLLSLEMDSVFKQCYVDGDISSLSSAARAIAKVQHMFGCGGIIPNIRSKGAASRKVLQKLMHMRREDDNLHGPVDRSVQSSSPWSIDTLVIMDREVDLVSPMITPLTYEGLIDEIIGIENGRIKVDVSILGADDKDEPMKVSDDAEATITSAPSTSTATATNTKRLPGEKVSIVLNNSDTVFSDVRNLSVEKLGAYLQERAILIRASYASFRDHKNASITEIHDFVKKMPALTKEYKSLNQHINIAELLKTTTDGRDFRELWQGERGMLEGEAYLDQVEDAICADTDRSLFYKTLRLLCLQSLTAGGIRSNRYDSLKRQIIQTYGYEHLFTINNLERAGLLKRKDVVLVETASVWQGIKQKLRLIDDRGGAQVDDNISYVAAGYAPMSVRLVQILGNGNSGGSWSTSPSMNEVMRLLPGPLIEFTQLESPEELSDAMSRTNADNVSSSASSFISSTTSTSIFSSSSSSTSSTFDGVGMGNRIEREGGTEKRVMLVFIVGGLTFLEIAAFRHLSKDPNFPFTIIMATTKLINGNTLLKSLTQQITFKPSSLD